MSNIMDDKPRRGLGGKLALLAFYLFCAYFVWAMVRYCWVVSSVVPGPGAGPDDPGTLYGKLLGALAGGLVLGLVGLILAGIVWYTRPRHR